MANDAVVLTADTGDADGDAADDDDENAENPMKPDALPPSKLAALADFAAFLCDIG